MPYDLTPDFLHELFSKHRIDYVIHGDDPCIMPDGTDAYAHAKKLGRFRMVSEKRRGGGACTCVCARVCVQVCVCVFVCVQLCVSEDWCLCTRGEGACACKSVCVDWCLCMC